MAVEIKATFQDQASPGIEQVIRSLQKMAEAAQPAHTRLVNVEQLLGQVHKATGPASGGLGTLSGRLRQAQRAAGSLSAGVEALASGKGFGGFTLAVGASLPVIGAFVALLSNARREAGEMQGRIANVSSAITANARATSAEIREIEAAAAGDQVGAAEAAHERLLILAAERRDALIRSAESSAKEAGEKESIRAAAVAAFHEEIRLADARLSGERTQIARAAAQEMADAEAERVTSAREAAQAIVEADRAAATARGAAALEVTRIEAEAAGDTITAAQAAHDKIVFLAEAERDAKLAALAAEQTDAARAAAERVRITEEATAEIAVADAELRAQRKRTADEEIALAQRVAAERVRVDAEMAAKLRQTMESLLGDQDRALAQRFSGLMDAAAARGDFQEVARLAQQLEAALTQAGAAGEDAGAQIARGMGQAREAVEAVASAASRVGGALTATGSPFSGGELTQGPTGTIDLASLLAAQRARPFDASISEAIRRVIASAQAERQASAFTQAQIDRLLGAPAPTGGGGTGGTAGVAAGGGGALPVRAGFGAPAVNVSFHGTNIIDEQRAIDALAGKIGRAASDRWRRGMG